MYFVGPHEVATARYGKLGAFEIQMPHIDGLEIQLYRTVRQRGKVEDH